MLTSGFTADGQRRLAGRRARGDGDRHRRDAPRGHAERPQADASSRATCSTRCRRSTKNWATLVEVTPGFTGRGRRRPAQLNQNARQRVPRQGGHEAAVRRHVDRSRRAATSATSSTPRWCRKRRCRRSGISAESNADGVVVNMIPKEGGNSFSVQPSGSVHRRQSRIDNLNDDLRARGLTTVSKILKIYDAGVTLRRADQEGQAVVLRARSASGATGTDGRQFLEQDAGHAVLHARSVTARRPLSVVRIQGHPRDVAGLAEEQVQRLRRRRRRLPVPGHWGARERERAGGGPRISLPADRPVSGRLERPGH